MGRTSPEPSPRQRPAAADLADDHNYRHQCHRRPACSAADDDSNGSSGSVASFNWIELLSTSAVPPPTAPANLAAVAASTSQINLAWTNTAGANETGFEIDRSTNGVNFTLLANVGATTTTYSDTGLNAATTYSYRVEAINSGGVSAGSNIASAVTQAIPTVPVNLSTLTWASTTAGWGTVQNNLSTKGNALTLRGTTYATGLGTHAASQIVYNLAGKYVGFVSDVGIDDETGGLGAIDFQVLGDGKVLFDSGVLTGTSAVVHINVNVQGVQQLTLLATNGIPGSIDYDHADWAGAKLLLPSKTAPTAPANLAATAITSSQIGLAWTNTAVNATAIEIDRSTDGINFTPLVTGLAPSTTTYTDTGLGAAKTYYYRLIASNSFGPSPTSSIASAQTLAATATTTYLSDLTWSSATTGWGTIQKDASIKGTAIKLRGTTYRRGSARTPIPRSPTIWPASIRNSSPMSGSTMTQRARRSSLPGDRRRQSALRQRHGHRRQRRRACQRQRRRCPAAPTGRDLHDPRQHRLRPRRLGQRAADVLINTPAPASSPETR